jgi:drug/metabolite transporter (DMT)-like permease
VSRHPQFWAYAALISVCIFWGTTYLSIRMALEAFPPLLMVAARYTLSVAAARGAHLPRGAELRRTALNGVLVLSVGNGCLALAEMWIPSGMAALIISISPFWMVGLDALMPRGERLHGPTLAGLAVGLLGAALLVGPGALSGGASGTALRNGFLILQVGSFSWCFGSLLQRRQPALAHPIVAGGVQQLAAGLAVLPLALLHGGPIHWSARGVGAVLYLVVFGTLVGYSSYVYAMAKLPVAVVSIYNYVNPVVAVGLGWLFYREPFGWREAGAMAVIFAGVALVKRAERRRAQSA